MRYHNGRPFSAKDKDPDPLGIHCARAYMGGWWYKNCYKTNLNGLYGINSNNQVQFSLMNFKHISACMIWCTDQIKFTFCVCCDTGNCLDRLERKRRLHSLHWDEVQTVQVLSCNSWLNMHRSSRGSPTWKALHLTENHSRNPRDGGSHSCCMSLYSGFDSSNHCYQCIWFHVQDFIHVLFSGNIPKEWSNVLLHLFFFFFFFLYNVLPDPSISTRFMFWLTHLPVHHHGMPPHYYCN